MSKFNKVVIAIAVVCIAGVAVWQIDVAFENRDRDARRTSTALVRKGCGPTEAQVFATLASTQGWSHTYVEDQAAEWVQRCQTKSGER